jgi:hypothetical protein
MFTRQLMLVFAGGFLVPLTAQSAPPVTVTARLYNTARVPAEAADAALAVARQAMGAEVRVSWQNCDIPDACGLVPAPGELIIRLVRSRDTASYVLGEASIDTSAGTGVLATVYADRVERMAAVSETDATVLLGRAIAHELGHLLMATNAHSASGLMRAKWTTADLRRDQMTDWLLTSEEGESIRRRLR